MIFHGDIETFDWVFLDLETTGLEVVEGDAICEIGMHKVRQGEVIGQYQSLVNPGRKVSPEAQKVHKISKEQLDAAPYFYQLAEEINIFLKDSVIFAYNVGFDMRFLEAEMAKSNYSLDEIAAVDILNIARENLQLPKYNLGELVKFFSINCGNCLHRAIEDAYAAAEVFFRLIEILKNKGIRRLEDFISLYGYANYGYKQQENKKLSLINEAKDKNKKMSMKYFTPEKGVQEAVVEAVNILRENKGFYLWCHSFQAQSFRVELKRILAVELIF